MDGCTAPRITAMDMFRWGSGGGTSLGEWEHNNNNNESLAIVIVLPRRQQIITLNK